MSPIAKQIMTEIKKESAKPSMMAMAFSDTNHILLFECAIAILYQKKKDFVNYRVLFQNG